MARLAYQIEEFNGIQFRIFWVLLAIVLLLTALMARLVYLQIYQHQQYETLSRENRVRVLPVPPLRGLILDRNGKELANNMPSYQLYVIPDHVDSIEKTVEELSSRVKIDASDMRYFRNQKKTRSSFEPHILKADLSDFEAARLSVDQFRYSGVHIDATSRRNYPYGEAVAHVVGYVSAISPDDAKRIDLNQYRGIDHIGKLGLEQVYESLLVGEPGLKQVEANAHGRTLQTLAVDKAKSGTVLHVSLDVGLQNRAANLLRGERGAAVAIEPATGDVLALVSAPTYDPNRFVGQIDNETYSAWRSSPDKPLLNRAVYGRYAPGSTIKPFLGMAALESKDISEEDTFVCNGQYYLEGEDRPFRCWNKEGHEEINLFSAISQSCDVFFYELGKRMGIDKISSGLSLFGLGSATGLDFTGESSGLIPTAEWKKKNRDEIWFPGETVITAIGQGYMLATPLQLAFAVAQIANRGKIIKPRLLVGTSNADGSGYEAVPIEEIPAKHSFSQQSYDYIIDSMRSVVSGPRGTARATGYGLTYTMAGKTGTSQIVRMNHDEVDQQELDPRLRDHALFIGFAPIINPEIAVAVIVENGESGSKKAAPIVRAMMDYYLGEARQKNLN